MYLINTLAKARFIKAWVRTLQTDTGVGQDFFARFTVANLAQGTGEKFKVTAGEVEACDFLFA